MNKICFSATHTIALCLCILAGCLNVEAQSTTGSRSKVSVRANFQLPTSCAPIMKPSSMSVRRDMPLHITMLPGGESLARAR